MATTHLKTTIDLNQKIYLPSGYVFYTNKQGKKAIKRFRGSFVTKFYRFKYQAYQEFVVSNSVDSFIKSRPTKAQIKARIKKYGRIAISAQTWDREEIFLCAKAFDSWNDFINNGNKIYNQAYSMGLLNEVISRMKWSKNRNQIVRSYLDLGTVISKALQCKNSYDMSRKFMGYYHGGVRYGIDWVEFFEKKDDAQYLQKLIKELAEKNLERSVG